MEEEEATSHRHSEKKHKEKRHHHHSDDEDSRKSKKQKVSSSQHNSILILCYTLFSCGNVMRAEDYMLFLLLHFCFCFYCKIKVVLFYKESDVNIYVGIQVVYCANHHKLHKSFDTSMVGAS